MATPTTQGSEASDLVTALQRFNRKERYWLLRNCFGDLRLCRGFLDRVSAGTEEPRIEIPDDAWWGFDYHFDWLAGALSCLANGTSGECSPLKNDDVSGLTTGRVEDIDLLIAFDRTLILVEAKTDRGYTNTQLQSKLKRVCCLRGFIDRRQELKGLEIRFLLLSPKPPIRLQPHQACAPDGWLKLEHFEDTGFLEISGGKVRPRRGRDRLIADIRQQHDT